nr:MAG TPA: hypothetical protein [Bacteriophage sp.]
MQALKATYWWLFSFLAPSSLTSGVLLASFLTQPPNLITMSIIIIQGAICSGHEGFPPPLPSQGRRSLQLTVYLRR